MPQASQILTIDFRGFRRRVNEVFYPLFSDEHRYLNLVGGAGSGKSVFAAQKKVKRLISEPRHKIGVFRKVAKTLRSSCFEEVLKVIGEWHLLPYFKVNQSDMIVRFIPNGNRIVFVGLDDPEKLKSIAHLTDIWIEEATELLPADFTQVDLRLRGETKHYKQIILTYNPISHLHWLKPKFFDVMPESDNGRYRSNGKALTLHTTYKDNRFLDAEYAEVLDALIGNARQVYKFGEWGKLEGLIYDQPVFDIYPEEFDETIYGLDFGYNNPMALLRIDLRDNEAYITEKFYATGRTTSDLIELLPGLGVNMSDPIYADSAEPDRIEELRRAGYNVYPMSKGAGSVQAGIDFIQSLQVHSRPENINYNAEKGLYQWRVDKDGRLMDEPKKENDHAMDAERGALWTHLSKRVESFIQ